MRTRLTSVERWFTGQVSKEHASQLERRLAGDVEPIFEISRAIERNRFGALVINLARFALLLSELLLAPFREVVVDDAVPFYEPDPRVVQQRLAHLTYHLPGQIFRPVTDADRVARGVPFTLSLRLLGVLLVTMGLATLSKPSLLTSKLVRIVRVCLLAYSYVINTPASTVYLFRLYRVEVAYLSAFLKDLQYEVNLVASVAPLSYHSRVLIGHSIKVCHQYQVQEFEHYVDLGDIDECELWAPDSYERLARRYDNHPIPLNSDVIGIYTQGFGIRRQELSLNRGFSAFANQRERMLLKGMGEYASDNPHVRIIVFTHPYERRYFQKTGYSAYADLELFPNVEVDLQPGMSSSLQFHRVGLGLTMISSIGFERLYLGLRTIFYVGESKYLNWQIASPVHNLFFKSIPDVANAIDACRSLTNEQFAIRYGLTPVNRRGRGS